MIQRSSIFGFLIIIGVYALVTSCETDIDLTAPYKSTPVITAVLEYTADTQFVRINRTYLTDNNVSIYAQNRDSVEYQPEEVEAWLIKKRDNEIQDSILLKHIVLPSRDPGVFFDEDVSFWYTSEALFTENEISDLTRTNPENITYALDVTARGENFVGETDFPSVKNSSIKFPFPSQPDRKLAFYTTLSGGSSFYNTLNFQYRQTEETGRYQNVLRMYFDYQTNAGAWIEDQFIDYELGIHEVTQNGQFSNPTAITFNTENWYAFVGAKLIDIADINTVKIKILEYRVTGANHILNSYINVTNPISDFTPVLSTFTNFNNGAIGILGSKTLAYAQFKLEDPSIVIFIEGEYGYGLSYCVDAWAGSTETCP